MESMMIVFDSIVQGVCERQNDAFNMAIEWIIGDVADSVSPKIYKGENLSTADIRALLAYVGARILQEHAAGIDLLCNQLFNSNEGKSHE